MTPTVTLKISNPHNDTYPTIILRKFFNMVFVEPDGKTLNIYTATIFGGAHKVDLSSENLAAIAPYPKHRNDQECALNFKYQIHYDDGTVASSSDISVSDVTDQFLSDDDTNIYHVKNFDEIHKFWGNLVNLEDQNRIGELLEELHPNNGHTVKCRAVEKRTGHCPAKICPAVKRPSAKRPSVKRPSLTQLGSVFFFNDDQENRKSHKCIVCKGNFDGNNVSNGYKLSVNQYAVPGIEAINWVKTTIHLKHNILKSKNSEKVNVRFLVQFTGADSYYTPDFTWYFAPPSNYVVDESATLKIGNDPSLPNKVAPVADGTTVRFKEWLDEGIGERKKSRVTHFSEYTKTKPYGFTNKTVEVLLSFVNPGKHGNFQFFVGLIASYLLSFCSDMGRLSAYKDAYKAENLCLDSCKLKLWFGECICENICHLLSLLIPILMVAVFCSIAYRRDQCFPDEHRSNMDNWAIRARALGLLASALLVLYINVGWLIVPKLLCQLVTTCVLNQLIVMALLFTALVGNIFYVIYCLKVKKRNLIDFF